MPLKFKSIGKSAKDLLTKQYDYNFTLETVNKSKEGFTMSSGFTMEDKTTLSGTSKMELEDPAGCDVEFNLKANGENVDEDTMLKCTLHKLTKGLDLSVSVNFLPEVTIEESYNHGPFALNSKFIGDFGFTKACLDLNAAFTHTNFTGGLNTAFDFFNKDEPIKTIDLGLQFQQKPHTVSLLGKKLQAKAKEFALGYHVTPKDDLAVGAQVSVKTSEETNISGALGVDYSVSPTTSLKAKLDCSKDFSYAIEHKLSSPAVKVNFAQSLNILGTSAGNWGFGLTFGDY